MIRRQRGPGCVGLLLVGALLLAVASAHALPPAAIEACIARAALHHHVNAAVLRAILRIESNFNPRAVGRNPDGSLDLGIGQINSRHFALLASHGVRPEHLLDACVGSYVAAWHLARLIAAHGNSWSTIARYHSATPARNQRYQLLLANELVAAGVIAGPARPVPAPAMRGTGATARGTGSTPPVVAAVRLDESAAPSGP